MESLKDIELQKHYDDLFEMFGTPGWARLKEQAQAMWDAANTLDGVTDERSLFHRRGELKQIAWVLGIQAMTEATYKQLVDDEQYPGMDWQHMEDE